MSQSERSERLVVGRRRRRVASASAAVAFWRSTALASDASIRAIPRAPRSSETSRMTVSYPARAQTSAIPEPIRPAPSTPTFLIAMV